MLDDLIKKINENPDNLDNYRALADFYISKKDWNKALLAYEEILKRNEADIQALLNSGSLMFYNHNYNKSIEFYKKGIQIEPENSLLHYNLGNVYAEMNNFNDALFEYNCAVKNGMKNAQIYNALGILYSDNGKYPDSKACFTKMMKLEPENPEYLANFGTLCQRMEDTDTAEELMLKSFELKQNPQVSLALANLYVQTGKKQKAEEYFAKTLDIKPDYYSAWVCRAIFCADEKDFDSSIKYYKNAIEIEPKKPNAYTLLAHLLSSEKRYNEAIDVYKKALDFAENKTMLYVFIANAYMFESDMKNAINYYRLAMKETKDNAEIILIYIDILSEFIEDKIKNAA